MLEYALFLGCNVQARLPQHEYATKLVFNKLGVRLYNVKQFNCCGYPLKNVSFKGSLLLSVRNLALAEQQSVDMMTLCGCGFGTLKGANQLFREDASLLEEMNVHLRKEDLEYRGTVEVKHFSQVLYEEIGLKKIKENLVKKFSGLKIATHYGCHTIRPSKVVQFDDPFEPSIFDQLVEVTGAKSVPWEMKLDCCGAPLWGSNNVLSMELTGKKLDNAKAEGANYLCSACSYCQLQFDRVQEMMLAKGRVEQPVSTIFYTQLLGLCLDIEGEELGLDMNHLSVGGLRDFL